MNTLYRWCPVQEDTGLAGAGRATHIVALRVQQQVERHGGDHVNDEPAFEIVNRYLARMRDDLVVLVNVRCAEVDDYVYDEHDVDEEVDDF